MTLICLWFGPNTAASGFSAGREGFLIPLVSFFSFYAHLQLLVESPAFLPLVNTIKKLFVILVMLF